MFSNLDTKDDIGCVFIYMKFWKGKKWKKKKRETEIRLKLPEAMGWRMGLIANGDERTLSDN